MRKKQTECECGELHSFWFHFLTPQRLKLKTTLVLISRAYGGQRCEERSLNKPIDGSDLASILTVLMRRLRTLGFFGSLFIMFNKVSRPPQSTRLRETRENKTECRATMRLFHELKRRSTGAVNPTFDLAIQATSSSKTFRR